MEVIVIWEECHGVVGVADSYKAAVDCAVDYEGGLDDIEIYREEKDCYEPLTEQEKKDIYTWGVETFNEKFEERFFLDVFDVWTS